MESKDLQITADIGNEIIFKLKIIIERLNKLIYAEDEKKYSVASCSGNRVV
jgi:hypothetical protein